MRCSSTSSSPSRRPCAPWGAGALVEDLDAAFAGAPRARVWVPQDELGAELAPELGALGLRAVRELVLAHDVEAAGPEAGDRGLARAAGRAEARALERE